MKKSNKLKPIIFECCQLEFILANKSYFLLETDNQKALILPALTSPSKNLEHIS